MSLSHLPLKSLINLPLAASRRQNLRALLTAAIVTVLPLSNVGAQAKLPQANNAPAQLSDLMVALQFQHIKLWFAGKLSNWTLAGYELRQIEATLQKAAALSSGNVRVGPTTEQLQSVSRAIQSKDTNAFTKAYSDLTNGCNTCHRISGYGSITIQVPANSPFPNQLFMDPVAQGRALAHAICAACHVISDASKEKPAARLPRQASSRLRAGHPFQPMIFGSY